MKNISIFLLTIALSVAMFSCNKQSNSTTTPTDPAITVPIKGNLSKDVSIASHDMALNDANVLLTSFVSSVDSNTTRGLDMDNSEPLREYLNAHPGIPLHFRFAHDAQYATEHYGQNSNGSHMTLIIFGTDASNNIILNARNAVFQHMGDLCHGCGCCANYLNNDGSLKYSIN